MPPLAPFVFKLSFKLPTIENREKNQKHINYINRYGAIDYGDLEPENQSATPETQAKEHGEDPIYAQYIHERPRSLGLFDQNGMAGIKATKEKLANHEGVVWRTVISLREDEAIRINHVDEEKWMESIRDAFPDVARKLGIADSNFEWVAAYHPEPGHPHCHLMFWEKEATRTRGVFSDGERRDVRKTFISKIYAQERERLHVEKTFYRDEIRNGVCDILGLRQDLDKHTAIIREELGNVPGVVPRITFEQAQELTQKLETLSRILPGHGRVALKLMPEEIKTEVRQIAEWVLRQPGFVQEMDKYLQVHDEISRQYTSQRTQLDQAQEKAYNDLRDRISQDLLKASVQMQRWGGETKKSAEHGRDKPDIPPPIFYPEKVPEVICAMERAAGGAQLDPKELKWTVYTAAWSLKEMGVSYRETTRLISDWVDRAGIDISPARLKDTVDRATLKRADDTPRWLGKTNWERLFNNLEVVNVPERPWQYPARGTNLALALWRGLWMSIQRERTKSEYQARRLEAEHEHDEKQRKEGREK